MKPATALITGADGKIGSALAQELHTRGFHVVVVGRDKANLEALDDGLSDATLVHVDLLQQPDVVNGLGRAIQQRFGHLDLAVFCAAEASGSGPVAHLNPDQFAKVIATNLSTSQRLIATLHAPLLAAPNPVALFLSGFLSGKAAHTAHGTFAFRADIAAAWAGLETLVACWNRETARERPVGWIATLPPVATPFRAATHPGENPDNLWSPTLAAQNVAVLCEQLRRGEPVDPALHRHNGVIELGAGH